MSRHAFSTYLLLVGCVVLGTVVACGSTAGGDDSTCNPADCGPGQHCSAPDGMCVPDEQQCTGLQCFQYDCTGAGKPPTTLTGTVFAPNGTLPLYNVKVYVPNGQVEPLPTELTCDRCGTVLSGSPIATTTTDTAGKFVLENVPATDNVPLV